MELLIVLIDVSKKKVYCHYGEEIGSMSSDIFLHRHWASRLRICLIKSSIITKRIIITIITITQHKTNLTIY